VFALGVVDQGERRLRNGGEFGRLARMVHPEFDHRDLVLVAKPQ
jgi:hypothetical protein